MELQVQALVTLSDLVERARATAASEAGITDSQARALWMVSTCGAEGVSSVAVGLGVTQPAATYLIGVLETKKLAVQTRVIGSRILTVRLSKKGEECLASYRKSLAEMLEVMLEGMTERARKDFLYACRCVSEINASGADVEAKTPAPTPVAS